MIIKKYSPKQQTLMKWATQTDYRGVICDGSVRSGKTVTMVISFVWWAMTHFNECNFGICGKTVRSAERNIIQVLLTLNNVTRYFDVKYSRSINAVIVRRGNRRNVFYIFGGRDESSYMLIQGITLAGVMFDEVALMPQSFVEQAIARTLSVSGSKLWFNCNPESPQHYFYTEWVQKAENKRMLHLHFTMKDNPILTPQQIQDAEDLYQGVFYERYILGRWVVAEGLIYSNYNAEKQAVEPEVRHYSRYKISVDYGTLNATSMGLWGHADDGVWYRIDEYYYSGRATQKQLTDEEYYSALEKLAGERVIDKVIVDPSAASFITCIKRHGKFRVQHASNAVIDGIRLTAVQLQQGTIKIQNNCKDIIREFGLYRWDEKSPEDRPIKDNDHAMDDMRYFVMDTFRGKSVRF